MNHAISKKVYFRDLSKQDDSKQNSMACHDSKNGTVPWRRARSLPRIIRFSIDFFSVFSVCHTKVKVMAIIVYSVRKKKNKTHIQLVMSAERNPEVRSSISTTKTRYLLLFRDGLQAPVLPNQPPVFCGKKYCHFVILC